MLDRHTRQGRTRKKRTRKLLLLLLLLEQVLWVRHSVAVWVLAAVDLLPAFHLGLASNGACRARIARDFYMSRANKFFIQRRSSSL